MTSELPTVPSTPQPEKNIDDKNLDFVTLNVTFKMPRPLTEKLEDWCFDFLTNLRVDKITKNTDSEYSIQATLQDKLMGIPQLVDDNMRLSEFTKMLQAEITTAAETVEMYHQLNLRDEEELKKYRDKCLEQSMLIEDLAKENNKFLEKKFGMVASDPEKIMAQMNSEKTELMKKASLLTQKLQLLGEKIENVKPHNSEEKCDYLPPV